MTIIHADILDWAKTYTGPKFHALLCDPPYHMTAPTYRNTKWEPDTSTPHGRAKVGARGFMNAQWDGVNENGMGIAFDPATWAALAEHLYPGAFGMAFASSRGWHRLACAIEDAGLIIHPTIFGWSYGSGFPKATRIDTQIDAQAFRAWLALHPEEQAAYKAAQRAERAARKAGDKQATKEAKAHLSALSVAYKAQAGLSPKVIGTKKQAPKFDVARSGGTNSGYNRRVDEHGQDATFDVTTAATEAAAYWLGHRYGGQALKPALEPIIVFQKPYDGSPLACITSSGAGALNIDAARIGNEEMIPRNNMPGQNGMFNASGGTGLGGVGRWPANLILSHSPACNGACAPGCPVAALGAQSGESSSTTRAATGADNRGEPNDLNWRMRRADTVDRGHDDTGTAARFFFQADYIAERLELADAIAYVAKASRSEREAGLDPRQTAIMRLLDDSDDTPDFPDKVDGHAVYGDFAGTPEHGSNMGSRRFDLETVNDGRETPIDNPYQRGETTRRNTHPTIKPIALARYLATLLLPPAQYAPRRLLIPFSGAGSEVIGADLAGWEEVTGVELGADHVAIANARRAYWQQRRWELGDQARKLTVKAAPKVQQGQVDMFVESEAA